MMRSVAAARECVGAPYRERGRHHVAGVDCVGLVLHVAQRCGVAVRCPEYKATQGLDASLTAFEAAFAPVSSMLAMAEEGSLPLPDPGAIVLVRRGRRLMHLAVYTGGSIVEASNNRGVGRVVERAMAPNENVVAWALLREGGE